MAKDNAMLEAMKSRPKPMESPEMPKPMVKVTYQDIPSLKEAKPGDPVTIYLSGTVNSSAMDGVMVEIDKFTDKEEKQEAKTEQKATTVRNQIQPYSGGF